MSDDVDVLVVGAGLSGIAAAYYVQTRLPGQRYLVLEARQSIGGTWDLFRYPGVRSDSDMHTLGFSFYPWKGDVSLAGGTAIKDYVEEVAQHFGIDRAIRFGERVVRARWSSASARWSVDVDAGNALKTYSCRFLFFCSGYYDYAQGYLPTWPGMSDYAGTLVHAQRWPRDLDVNDKRVVVIGSGATAVTIVPAIAGRAQHVTMLQRSPTYVVSLPARDAIAQRLYSVLPASVAHGIVRWKNVLLQIIFYNLMRKRPKSTRERIKRMIRDVVGPSVDVDAHFTPRYEPWDQRLCLVPDNDLFLALRDGRASIVTDDIDHFNRKGMCLKTGKQLDADIVVAATGLKLQLFGGATLEVDGRAVKIEERVSYKGMMLNGVPNAALSLGYTNASWTLKCELTALYVARVLHYMNEHGYRSCVVSAPPRDMRRRPAVPLQSGYVRRALHELPMQGERSPWRLYQNFILDLSTLKFGRIDDGVMEFAR